MQHFLDTISAPVLQAAALVPESAALPPAAGERFKTLAEDARVFAQVQTYLGQALLACALERYRFKNGGYPDKLSALAPGWLAAIPNDPITGQLPEYERRPDGFFADRRRLGRRQKLDLDPQIVIGAKPCRPGVSPDFPHP